jgi:phosphoribosylformimino-5-aminoimidazole carboxamide ribotide isomerase
MLLIPAIDLKDGKCVRLRQGRMDDNTVYSDDPVAMAGRWVEQGARRLHIVDLDGAIAGKPVNSEIVREIARSFPDVPIQVGGGIRDEDTIQTYLDAGVRYVIIGTKAVNAPHFVSDICLEFPGHIIVGLDVRDGKVAIDGWSKLSRHDAIDLALKFEQEGVEAVDLLVQVGPARGEAWLGRGVVEPDLLTVPLAEHGLPVGRWLSGPPCTPAASPPLPQARCIWVHC